jgi:uncharacterized protein (DUF488 family)
VQGSSNVTVWTIGHSNRTLQDFLELLQANAIHALADVRRFPGSRRYPHFGQELLAQSLSKAGIEYIHLPELGGRRGTRADSHNTAWRHPAFRGYADYMETPEFERGIERLLVVARAKPAAIMCAEALWWQWHRGLISDWLKARGHTVMHIMRPGKVEEHPFTTAASIIDGGGLSYRGQEPELPLARTPAAPWLRAESQPRSESP